MTSWAMAAEAFDSADGLLLRREYYAEVASRYRGRPVTAEGVDRGLADDGAGLLAPPTGQFVVGRFMG